MTRRFFITGSGTGVGKTLFTAAWTHQLRAAGHSVRALKPVISGYSASETTDTHILLTAQGLHHDCANIDATSPFRYLEPLSPDMAALRAGRSLDFDRLLLHCQPPADTDILLIEGVGGVLVPLSDCITVRDWILALEIDVIVVVGSYLGTLSHTLCALEALWCRDIEVAALVVSESAQSPVPLAETVSSLRNHLPTHLPIQPLPRLAGVSERNWARAATFERLAQLV